MLYEGALVPILASLVYCGIVAFFWHCNELGCVLPPLKGPTVDTDAVGAIATVSETGCRDVVYCLKACYVPLSVSISVDAHTGTHRCLSVLIADVVLVILLQHPTHHACTYEYLYPLSLILLVFFLNIYF